MKFKKLVSVAVAFAMLGTVSICSAETVTETPVQYVALGDSIAKGYGLAEDESCYVDIVAENYGQTYSNLAVNGMNSEEFIEYLKTSEVSDAVKSADVITVSMGSNDLLEPFMSITAETLGIDTSDGIESGLASWFATASALEKMQGLKNLKTALTDNAELLQACEDYKTIYFPQMISDIRELNPDAELLFSDMYNPFYNCSIGGSLLPLGELSDTYITKINEAFDYNAEEYITVDVYTPMNNTGLTNVKVSSTNPSLDPHPNRQGHKVIADTFITTRNENRPLILLKNFTLCGEVNRKIYDTDKNEVIDCFDTLALKQSLMVSDN